MTRIATKQFKTKKQFDKKSEEKTDAINDKNRAKKVMTQT